MTRPIRISPRETPSRPQKVIERLSSSILATPNFTTTCRSLWTGWNFVSERQELERTVQLDPNFTVAHNQLGLLALRNGQQAEAELYFKKTLAIRPHVLRSTNNLGVLYSQEGKNEEAASLFQQAIKNDPKYAKAYVNLDCSSRNREPWRKPNSNFGRP